ncbi:hypothetical protein GR7B_00152 [Vibrio phage vB_VcorM_GR7B]|nr:hypothetical protein GR7B_00152 [Vibrio phage vB_VcorM_GR7B]
MADIVRALSWLRNGEPGSGSTADPAGFDGVLNRPLKELLDNDILMADLIAAVSGVKEQINVAVLNSPVSGAIETLYNVNVDGAITINFPSGPSHGDTLRVRMVDGDIVANTVTLNGNGKTIGGNATQLLDQPFFDFIYAFDTTAASGAGDWVTVSGGSGVGSGIGIPAPVVVTASATLEKDKPVMVDRLTTFEFTGLSTSKFNDVTLTMTALSDSTAVTLPAAYHDGSTVGSVTNMYARWTGGNFHVVKNPTNSRWMLFDSTDSNGLGGWYIQSDNADLPNPGLVDSWSKVTGAITLAPVVEPTAEIKKPAITITFPTSPSNGDSVYIGDLWQVAGNMPWNLNGNSEPIESVRDEILFDVSGASAEFTFITGYGWALVRGSGVASDASSNNTSGATSLIYFDTFKSVSETGSYTPKLTEANIQHFNLSGALELLAPDKGAATGGTWIFKFIQDATGGHDVTWAANYHVNQGVVGGLPNEVSIATVVNTGDDQYDVSIQNRRL